MIQVLIVDDSPLARKILSIIMSSDRDLQIVGEATNGEDAVNMALALRPDIITMDIRMPRMNGFEATKKIMETCPTPIIIVSSSVEAADLNITFNAVKAGALTIVEKPKGFLSGNYDAISKNLIKHIKLMSQVKVVRQRNTKFKYNNKMDIVRPNVEIQIIGIGGSTGGPSASYTILSSLPSDFKIPVILAQHITKGFTEGFAEWLKSSSKIPVKVAGEGDDIRTGGLYIAPDDAHIIIKYRGIVSIDHSDPYKGHRPSINNLFESLAAVYGASAMGVLLTGMGDDGARGIGEIKAKGGITIAQDEATSVVFGMPREAIELGAIDYVLPVNEIGNKILSITGKR